MRTIRIEDVDRGISAPEVKRSLSTALGTANLAMNYYELAPGESVSFGYHAHADQEEVFYVQSGTITFETDDGQVVVDAGAVARSPPGEYKQGRNTGEGRATVLALGAPRGMGETDIRRECPDCGARTSQTVETADEDLPPSELQVATAGETTVLLRCVDCGAVTGQFE
ncbi:MAG: cupin domain-containing protein [Salinigranum sp.]